MNTDRAQRLHSLAERVAKAGTGLTVEAPGVAPIRVGSDPGRTRIVLRDVGALDALLSGHHMALAEASAPD